ncbi:DUF2605 domain-containing protein [Rubidibacter lacunae]|uniref:DUF2605 domain-containing protein n=1 Tax=Rubidibacter lacunae TaxID=582514 RepID=UPI002FBDF1AD
MLKAVLGPLLADFQYWFSRSRDMLETRDLPMLQPEERDRLLERLKQAQLEVTAAEGLFRATDGAVGIDMNAVAPWHQLVTECWRVSALSRQSTGITEADRTDESAEA